jgi:hypothetical protein
MVRNSNDIAPYVGLGRVLTKLVNGQYKYKVEFLNKVKFSEPSQDNNTKGESVEFGTSEIEGQVAALANGNWSISKTFDTFNAAQTYLESLFGSSTAATVSFNNNGGTGSYESVSTYVGAIIPVPDGSDLTPPTGYHFIGWDTTSTSSTADVQGTFKVDAASVTLYAIYEED